MLKESKIYTILREPLLHFLLIGTALFFIYAQMNDSTIEDDKYIHITNADIERVFQNWTNSRGRTPSDIEKQKEIDNLVKEEILVREAIARGLNRDDSLIRRHLVKKMSYIFDDNTLIPEPTDEQLQNYLSKNNSKFLEPATISFNQIVFTQNSSSASDIDKKANNFLQRLKNSSSSKISTVGDLVDLSKKGISNTLGEEFSTQVFDMPIKNWVGPVKSNYGLHLIYIHSRTQEQTPKLSKIKKEVAKEWQSEQRKRANDIFYKNLSKQYSIMIDKDSSQTLSRQ